MRNTHLWYSFLQGKRCAVPASHELVLTAYEDHRKAMEIEDPIDDVTHDEVMEGLAPILRKLNREVRYIKKTDLRSDLITRGETQHVASTRACYEKSRENGGQMGYLRALAPSLERCDPARRIGRRTAPELARMVFHPWALIGGVVYLNIVLEEYEYADGEYAWYDAILRQTIRYVGGVRLKATIQAVLEPLKVRVISKGEAVPYYVSKLLQRALHDAMRKMDCFRLIGRPMSPTDLMDLAANRVKTGEGRDEWFSIDYSAATDRLSARLSASILERITEGADADLRRIWLSVLAPHWCRYPFPFNEEVKPVTQRNGQLMGSILSFPVLCLANLGLYLRVIRNDPRRLREKLNGVLVNGDDMLYVAPRSLWDDHVRLGERVGLSMSPGKAYHHPIFANVNSACYHYHLKPYGYEVMAKSGLMVPGVGHTPYSIPFLNTGLYFGQGKVLGGDDVKETRDLASTVTELLRGSWFHRKTPDIFRMFVSRHSSSLRVMMEGRNFFAHQSRGGYGVPLLKGIRPDWTRAQLKHSDRVAHGKSHGFGPTWPLVPIVDTTIKAPWLVPMTESGPRLRGGTRIAGRRKMEHPIYSTKVDRCATFLGRPAFPEIWEYAANVYADAVVECQEYALSTNETLEWLRGFC